MNMDSYKEWAQMLDEDQVELTPERRGAILAEHGRTSLHDFDDTNDFNWVELYEWLH